MPLTVPTWIVAIATAVIAIGVIVAARLAGKALSARTRQLADHSELISRLAEVLDLQAKDLRLSIDQRRRAQACQVFIDLTRFAAPATPRPDIMAPRSDAAAPRPNAAAPPHGVTATVRNNSQQPVYDLYVIWQLGTVRMGRPDRAARLLPEHEVCFERAPEPSAADSDDDPAALSAFLTFRDAAGTRWTVREDGTLSDIPSTSDIRATHD
jgi:hypothetical protein